MEIYSHFEAANKLGDIYISQWRVGRNRDDLDSAIEAYDKATQYNSEHPRGLRSLAYFKLAKLNTQLPLNAYGAELQQIYKKAEKAVGKKMPEEWHWQSLDVQGWVLYNQNKITLAIKKLEESVSDTYGKEHVSNHYHLAEAYIQNRSLDLAKEALEKGQKNLKKLSQSPEFETENFLTEKIKALCNQLGMNQTQP